MKKYTIKLLFLNLILVCSCKLSSNDKPALHEDVIVHKSKKTCLTNQCEDLFQIGLDHFEDGNYEKAKIYFQKCDSLEQNNPIILTSLGNCFYFGGNIKASYKYFSNALKADSTNPEAYAAYGYALNMENRYKESISILTTGVNKTNTNQFTHYNICHNLACAFYAIQECDKAGFYNKAAKNDFGIERFDKGVADLDEQLKSYCK